MTSSVLSLRLQTMRSQVIAARLPNYREYVETWVHEAKTPLVAAYLMLENLDDALANNARPSGGARKGRCSGGGG